MKRRPCVVAVTENGETRCGLTTAYRGLGGIPSRLIKRETGKDGNLLPLFENMKLQSEVSLEQYLEYLDHPENADDFSAMVEIDIDHNIIRVDEDMGEEREYYEFPIDLLVERAWMLKDFTKKGPDAISQKRIYKAMEHLKEAPPSQKLGLTEKGRQALQDATDPSKTHSYRWYVIENINAPEQRVDHDLPLEEAVHLYAGLDCADKRLGVTKDSIASVDLAIRYDGREWISEDWTKLDSFKDDPVAAEAVSLLQQTMEEQTAAQGPTIGGMNFG